MIRMGEGWILCGFLTKTATTGSVRAMGEGRIYFHAPCFDGIASAVLAWDFLEVRRGWLQLELQPVDYDLREAWLDCSLVHPGAVVDFLYHPAAEFWADHHETTFLTETARQHFEARRGPDLIYDDRAGSCAVLLRGQLANWFDNRNPSYEDLVYWAEKIDAARYESVKEAMESTVPALRINLSLAVGRAEGYCEDLVRALRKLSLEEVAQLPVVQRRFLNAQALADAGLERFRHSAHLEGDGIVVFDVDTQGALVSRYAPYYFFPNARYSVGVVRSEDRVKVTAMRNPWFEFSGVPLGRIAEKLGGGGHWRVGSIALRAGHASAAEALVERFVSEIRKQEAAIGAQTR